MDAALLTVYHLAAARDPATAAQLENTVVLLVPVLNPDGYNRASTALNTYRGEAPVANLQHAEHNGTWPRGRTNHYWFALNRQWIARTQPEVVAPVTKSESTPLAFNQLRSDRNALCVNLFN